MCRALRYQDLCVVSLAPSLHFQLLFPPCKKKLAVVTGNEAMFCTGQAKVEQCLLGMSFNMLILYVHMIHDTCT